MCGAWETSAVIQAVVIYRHNFVAQGRIKVLSDFLLKIAKKEKQKPKKPHKIGKCVKQIYLLIVGSFGMFCESQRVP